MIPGARWATDELCGEDLRCIEALTSDTLTMYRFAERDDFEYGIGCVNTWVSEDGRDC